MRSDLATRDHTDKSIEPAVTEPPTAHGPARRLLGRALPGWLKPRLGQLRAQYSPRPLTVPAGYCRVTPPNPAPTISVVTPSLNHGRFIARTIESILGQAYPELEYIIMDGGSIDETLDIVDRYRDQIHHFESGPDAGQASAINRGFAHSSGEIMAWLNSDDLLLPGSLARVANLFADHPEVDLIYGHRVLIDEEDRDIGIWITPPHGPDSLKWFDFLPQETAFWRRSLWERAGGIDEAIGVAFDWDLFLRFQAAEARIVRIPRLLGGFRLHPGQKTQVHQRTALAELAEIRQRANGRPISLDEARARVDHMRLMSLPRYAWHRCAARISSRRVPVFPS